MKHVKHFRTVVVIFAEAKTRIFFEETVLSLRAGAKRQHYHISATAMRGEALPGKMKCSHLRLPLIGLADADLPGGRAQYFLSPGR